MPFPLAQDYIRSEGVSINEKSSLKRIFSCGDAGNLALQARYRFRAVLALLVPHAQPFRFPDARCEGTLLIPPIKNSPKGLFLSVEMPGIEPGCERNASN